MMKTTFEALTLTVEIPSVLEIFPAGQRGYVAAIKQLGAIAANLRALEDCRLRGDEDAADVYRLIIDRLYRELPYWAR